MSVQSTFSGEIAGGVGPLTYSQLLVSPIFTLVNTKLEIDQILNWITREIITIFIVMVILSYRTCFDMEDRTKVDFRISALWLLIKIKQIWDFLERERFDLRKRHVLREWFFFLKKKRTDRLNNITLQRIKTIWP